MKHKIWAFVVIYLLLIQILAIVPPTTSDEPPPEGWTEDMRLTEVDNRTSTQPRIAKDSQGNLHIVFNDFRHGPPELYYMKVDNEGNILINETTLTTLDSISSRLGDCACDSFDNIVRLDELVAKACQEISHKNMLDHRV